MSFQFQQIPADQIKIPGENNFHTITPYFTYMNLLNQVKSEQQGKAVYEMKEVCQLRFAGDRYYSPVVPVNAMYRKVGLKEITFAERWATQYQQFLASETQIADGTPLEELTAYGITPAQLSMCRATNIHTIEALYHLEGKNAKSLGHHINDLRPMAKKFMDARSNGSEQAMEIAELRKQIEEMRAASVVIPPVQVPEEEYEEALFGAMTEDELRAIIEKKTETKVDRRLGHAALVNMAKGL